jgi:hypothetical protein
VKRILTRLQFHAFDDDFDCSRADLIRLGRRANPALIDDRAALAHGATQFKVNFTQLRKVLGDNDWAKHNILVAVAGGVMMVRPGCGRLRTQLCVKRSRSSLISYSRAAPRIAPSG